MHIAIAGNIGAGKTSLTELLHKHYGWEALYEDVVENHRHPLKRRRSCQSFSFF